MNRTIKFRAWDIRDHRMIPPEEIAEIQNQVDDEIDYVINLTEARHVRPISHVRLLQYTGLKDKNGKEIYEEDIIKWKHPMEDIGVVKFGCVNPNMSVFYLDVKRLGGCIFQDDDIYEVIGNIFENPELLK